MRKHKYRVWTGSKMLEVDHNRVEGEYALMLDREGWSLWSWLGPHTLASTNNRIAWFKDPNARLLEYTGLKDRHGKEIYEGDIVQFTAFKVTMRQEVSWGAIFHETQMGDTHSGAGFEIMDLSDPSTCEVIGNRYQNPELIPA